jgi:hypothetical protein
MRGTQGAMAVRVWQQAGMVMGELDRAASVVRDKATGEWRVVLFPGRCWKTSNTLDTTVYASESAAADVAIKAVKRVLIPWDAPLHDYTPTDMALHGAKYGLFPSARAT